MTVKEINKQDSDMVRLVFWKKIVTLVSVWKMSWQSPTQVLIMLGPILGAFQETPHTVLSVHDNTCEECPDLDSVSFCSENRESGLSF